MPDRRDLDSRWQRNEAELNRLYGLSPINRESFGARIDQLESEQDAIDFDVGAEAFSPGSKRWSGLP